MQVSFPPRQEPEREKKVPPTDETKKSYGMRPSVNPIGSAQKKRRVP